MTYRIQGLEPGEFSEFFAMSTEQLKDRRAMRVIAGETGKYPCRVSLEDAAPGEELVLLHHIHHAVETPYRSAFAIFVRKAADRAAVYVDRCPPVFAGRPLSLRSFDEGGCLVAARLAMPGEADAAIREALADPAVAYIDAHNAAHGCFAARIRRYDGADHGEG